MSVFTLVALFMSELAALFKTLTAFNGCVARELELDKVIVDVVGADVEEEEEEDDE